MKLWAKIKGLVEDHDEGKNVFAKKVFALFMVWSNKRRDYAYHIKEKGNTERERSETTEYIVTLCEHMHINHICKAIKCQEGKEKKRKRGGGGLELLTLSLEETTRSCRCLSSTETSSSIHSTSSISSRHGSSIVTQSQRIHHSAKGSHASGV